MNWKLPAAIILAAITTAAQAQDAVWRDGKDVARLTMGPCHAKVLQLIAEPHRGRFRGAVVTIDGKQYLACWMLHQASLVYVHFEDGDNAFIPAKLFRTEPGV